MLDTGFTYQGEDFRLAPLDISGLSKQTLTVRGALQYDKPSAESASAILTPMVCIPFEDTKTAGF